MADATARELAAAECELAEQERWEVWKALQEASGFTVAGSGFHDARVLELPDGPTHDVKVG